MTLRTTIVIRFALVLTAFFCAQGPAAAEEALSAISDVRTSPLEFPESGPDRAWRLFLHTNPPGARVSLNGRPLTGRTPLLIGRPETGLQEVHFEKAGYDPVDITLVLGAGQVMSVETILVPTGARLYFQDGVTNDAFGATLPPGGYSIDPGVFEIRRTGRDAHFIPVYPNQRWIDGLNIGIVVSTALGGALFVSEAVDPAADAKLSPFTIGLLVTDLVMIGADIGLHVHRKKWRDSWRIDPAEALPLWAEEDYRRASGEMEAGEWTEARRLFDRYVATYPIDGRTAEALYLSARLAYLQEDDPACRERLETLFRNFPVPALWDRSMRLSADLAFRQGRNVDGLAALEQIFALDESVDMEDVALKKATILTELAAQSGDYDSARAAWHELIAQWPESPLIDDYERSLANLEPPGAD